MKVFRLGRDPGREALPLNKKMLRQLEQGRRTTLLGRLYLTATQRKTLLKWTLYSLFYLLMQVLQDVIFCRIRFLGAPPDVVPGCLLLICMLEQPASGGVFVLCASLFRCLTGVDLGAFTLAFLVFGGIFLSAFRRTYLVRRYSTTIMACCFGTAAHQLCLFLLGRFLGRTTFARLPALLGGLALTCLSLMVFYFPLYAISKIGGNPWSE